MIFKILKRLFCDETKVETNIDYRKLALDLIFKQITLEQELLEVMQSPEVRRLKEDFILYDMELQNYLHPEYIPTID